MKFHEIVLKKKFTYLGDFPIKQKNTSNKLILKVIEIKGHCPVYKVGEKTIISGSEIDLENTDKACVHALLSLGSFIVGLREGIPPLTVGLSKKKGGPAYFQCLDPDPPWTNGGKVLFEVSRVPAKNDL